MPWFRRGDKSKWMGTEDILDIDGQDFAMVLQNFGKGEISKKKIHSIRLVQK